METLARLIGRIIAFVVPVAIIIAAIYGAKLLISGKPEVPRTEYERSAFFVETISVAPSSERQIIRAFGTVRPHRQATLQAEVAGRILRQHESLVLGGLIPAGEELVGLDERDYKFAVEQARGDVARAELDLVVERGQRQVAEREWKLLGNSVPQNELGRSLALRVPQIKEREAALGSARSRLQRAELDQQRTRVLAPFNALVLEESSEIGELMTARNSIARLACTDAFHVDASLPLRDLEIVSELLRGGGSPRVTIRQDLGGGRFAEFEGEVFKLLGALQAESRMARILIEVKDPLRISEEGPGGLPLLLGAYVEVMIEGAHFDDAVLLPRRYVRAQDRAWVMNDENRLDVRELEIADRRADDVLVVAGLTAGDRLVTSAIPTPVVGMELRERKDEESSTGEKNADDQANVVTDDDDATQVEGK